MLDLSPENLTQILPDQQKNIRRLCDHSPLFVQLLREVSKEECFQLFRPLEKAALPDEGPRWCPELENGDVEACMRELRIAKCRGMRHLLWWELGLHGDIEVSARALAVWAGGLLFASLKMAENLLQPRFGVLPGGRFSVIGLGKLGGRELNLGSDVDLLFIYDAPEDAVSDGRKSLSAKEYYAHLSRMLIKLMSERTADGQVWPMDMRLRPGGDAAPICLSLEETLGAYEDYGQTWERAMLLKARPVAGDMELGNAFIEGVRPFVFRRYLDYTTIQALAEMKRRIDKQAGNHTIESGFDVKRGSGGIREIEFFIQSFQLLHAGRNEALRVQPSMQALEKLSEYGVVEAEDAVNLRDAYRFWRRIEHAVQARNGEQTHKLPEDYRDYLTAVLELSDVDAEMSKQALHVRKLFDLQFADVVSTAAESHSWLDMSESECVGHCQLFDEDGQKRIAAALAQIRMHLTRGLLPERSYGEVARILDIAMPEWCRDANGVQAVEYFAELLVRIAGRATWVDLLATNEGVLRWLIGVLSASRYIARHVATDPSWLEWPLEKGKGEARIHRIIGKLDALDAAKIGEESFLADFGRLIDQARLTCAMDVAVDASRPEEIGRWLSDTADAVTRACLRLALHQFGLPQEFPFVCLAFGKHGSQSMGLMSDLDMVFVLVSDDPTAEGPKGKNLREWAQRLGRRMIQHLTTQPPFGAGFEFDARLRPSGDSGVLVTTIQAFREYQLEEAQTWEHQALCRARAITGPEAARAEIMAVVDEVIAMPRDSAQLKADVLAMRQKMFEHLASKDADLINIKQDEGGLVDIEFLSQYARLAFGGHETGTLDTFLHLPDSAPRAWKEAAEFLAETFRAYRQMENTLRVQLWESPARLPADDAASQWETLRRHAPIRSVAELRERMQKVRGLFLALLA